MTAAARENAPNCRTRGVNFSAPPPFYACVSFMNKRIERECSWSTRHSHTPTTIYEVIGITTDSSTKKTRYSCT